jgi:hypothetical protein
MACMSLRERVGRRLSSRHAPRFAAALGALLSLPSLLLGELMDDHLLHQGVRLGDPPWSHMNTGARGQVWHLREEGMFGWWASEDFRVAFMRPLSGLTHTLDYTLWPQLPWVMHLENVAVYTLLILVVGRVFLRLFGPSPITGLASLAFAIDELHAASVVWIAGRNTILAALFGMLALLAHLRWREADGEGRRWPFAIAGPLCFALALLSAEAGLAALGYLVAWAVTQEREGWAARVGPLVPYFAVVIIWRVAHVQLGYGATDSTIYTDPFDAPLSFVGTALVRAPALAFTALSLPLTDIVTAQPRSVWLLVGGFVVLAWALAPLWSDPRARFWALGMLACTVPFAATSPSSRTMLILGPGAAALLAMAWTRRREPELGPRARRWLIGFMAVCQLVIAPLAYVPLMASSEILDEPSQTMAHGVALPLDYDRTVVYLNIPTEINALYPKAIRRNAGGPWPRTTYVLYAGRAPVTAKCVAEDAIELEAEGGWAAAHIDRLTRNWSRRGFAVGDRVKLRHATVEVLEVESDARPRRIRVRFDVPLRDLSLQGFDGTRLDVWQPEVGDERVLQAEIGL